MISESHYWKDDLLKIAKSLLVKTKQARWPEASFISLEKNIFFGFYIVRKLTEAKKISNRISKQSFSAYSYVNRGKMVHLLNNHRIDKLYDLSSRKRVSINLPFMCNQIIHSYVFIPGFNRNNRLSSIFFSSDYERNRKLYEVEIKTINQLLKSVGTDYPSSYRAEFDDTKMDYKFIYPDDKEFSNIFTRRLTSGSS